MKFLKWLIYSSENPDNFSLTIKGALLTAIPVIVMIAGQLNFTLDVTQLQAYANSVVIICTGIITLTGIVRKLYNTFSDKEIVTFTKKKSTK